MLRRSSFGNHSLSVDPDDGPYQEYVTEELPPVPPQRDRFGRRLS
jgi:hypothetical protein